MMLAVGTMRRRWRSGAEVVARQVFIDVPLELIGGITMGIPGAAFGKGLTAYRSLR